MVNKSFMLGPLRVRLNWAIAACVIVSVAGLVRLGIWQLDRAAEKLELHNSFIEMGGQAPSDIGHVPVAGREYDAVQLQNRQVTLRGHYQNERSIFLIYQTFEDQIGFEVVTPFKLSAREEIVLVSRGWTGANSYETLRDSLPAIEGEQEPLGQIYVPRAAEAARRNGLNEAERVQWPLLMRHFNVDELQPFFSLPLFPYVVRLNEGQQGLLVRHWPEVHVDTGRNFSYALQWFAMAIALAVVSLLLSTNLLQLLGFQPAGRNGDGPANAGR